MNCENQFTAHTQLKLSPFFERTSKLNESQEWRRWSGFLAATNYELHHENEYFAIRTKAGLLDITPLKKYIIEGPDAQIFLNRLVTRNIAICKVGQVMYSPWCDEFGKVIDDGTIQRLSENKFRITSAEPNLDWIQHNASGMNLTVTDDSFTTAALALQGPNSRTILNAVASDSLDSLKFFWMMDTTFGNISVSISRTGYTGDLGYEIWMDPKDAIAVWDLLLEKGKSFGITPTGLQALDIARIEAGLILLDVDYVSSRHAIIESRKSSPYELGLGWAVKMKKKYFIGKKALEAELARGPEWDFVGIEIQWHELEKHFRKAGLAPGLPSAAWRTSTPLYKGNKQVGYATSGAWSPILKRYIALAHVKSEFSVEGSELMFELKVEHYRKLTPAKVVKTPFFDPERKRSCPA
ncbi:MAG: aminomethyl transferase family protein [Candidatus Marinimicrobia bacterium]|jgi:aminomethyltransferase|nr:aminomethyl transferase family protein [Candidatus Neomarinimicrobiota bacterium]MBT3676010.1 aminomethyl transferase family protein [Candidatus Neomarinimicrobiota bacterium]MBT3762506.1 aminomethyl transferase family protein [Candidatus Neomarinimicrobiota bacterium]MBT4068542.1 aminomethyl transferase family protein [Candidatus Neomarinimicrobiota bacterium]MBT4269811.1 aminomethyl transferase family protein [Candidatus Neomarinimicrobiota bacterium]